MWMQDIALSAWLYPVMMNDGCLNIEKKGRYKRPFLFVCIFRPGLAPVGAAPRRDQENRLDLSWQVFTDLQGTLNTYEW